VLELLAKDGAPAYLVSPLLTRAGVRHCFSTRVGGVSRSPFDSLNLGNPGGDIQDDWANIHENYRRLQQAIACNDLPRCWVHQVHGGDVAETRRGNAFENGQRADALVGDDPGKLLAVRTADCVPVLLSTSDGRCVAAVHAGWRGVIAQVIPSAIQRMRQIHQAPLLAAIGPAIGPDHFEVGQEVLAEFEARFSEGIGISRRSGPGKGFVDLRRAIRAQLLDAGVPDESIEMTGHCTFRDGELFYSHRRDRGVTGRMAALIAAAG